jgi:uncharacterized membrane protein
MINVKAQPIGKWRVTLAIFFLSFFLLIIQCSRKVEVDKILTESSNADRTSGEVTLDQETLEQMQALGYL